MEISCVYARNGLSGILLLLLILRVGAETRASTWDYCGCHWETWGAWSSCTETCSGGYTQRSRKVRFYDIPGCTRFTDCAANEDGWEFQRCNTNCFNGGSFVEWGTLGGYCRCPTGYLGNCCETIVTCGYPGDISNGRVVGASFTYNQVVQYECNEKYNLTGYASRRCTLFGTWSDMSPTCQFARHCESSPCKNGATCVDGLGYYTCVCVTGWTGAHCEVDIQPPVMEGCSGNVHKYVSNLISEITWPAPTFTDPMATSLIIQSNYDTNSSDLPWGDFTVQYVATKPSNGLYTECVFNISVRPNPCDELAAPANGILMCNGWQKDYYQLCLFTCLSGYSLPQGFSYSQWYACGASGNWIPSIIPKECREDVSDLKFGNPVDIGVLDCANINERQLAQEYYLDKLNSSDFGAVCTDHQRECISDNVDILCS